MKKIYSLLFMLLVSAQSALAIKTEIKSDDIVKPVKSLVDDRFLEGGGMVVVAVLIVIVGAFKFLSGSMAFLIRGLVVLVVVGSVYSIVGGLGMMI